MPYQVAGGVRDAVGAVVGRVRVEFHLQHRRSPNIRTSYHRSRSSAAVGACAGQSVQTQSHDPSRRWPTRPYPYLTGAASRTLVTPRPEPSVIYYGGK